MKVVISGGAGFIGSRLALRLSSENHEVMVLDSLVGGERRVPLLEAKGIEVKPLDIRHADARSATVNFRPDVIFHLAAQLDVRVSVRDPIYDADVNILGTLNMLEAARETGSRFVFTSSGGCIYGEVPGDLLPVAEDYDGEPDSPYGISKKVMDLYLRFFERTLGVTFVSLALGNVYGPGQDPHGEAGVVAIFGQRLIKGETCVIYGDGKQTRDYVFVDDVVDAYLAAVEKGDSEMVNIGTGIETSVEALYDLIAKASSSALEPHYEPPRAGELQRSCLGIEKARAVLSWSPKVTLEEGLRLTLESLRAEG